MKDSTHMITLSIGISSEIEWQQTWGQLNDTAKRYGRMNQYVMLSSTMIEQGEDEETPAEDELYVDEDTLFKVRDAIRKCVQRAIGPRMTQRNKDELVNEIINELGNAGILFRERR